MPGVLTRAVNPVYLWILRTTAHRLLSPWLLGVSFRGRRTGRRYQLPIGYVPVGDTLVVGTDARWRHNFGQPHPAEVWWRGRRRAVVGAVVKDPDRMLDLWAALLERRPVVGKLSGIRTQPGGAVVVESLATARAAGWDVIELHLKPDDVTDLAGMVAVVTGATSGIGRATALALARRGADVTAVGRDQDCGRKLESHMPDRIRFVRADLSTSVGVRAAARTVLAGCARIDVLVHSAGGHLLERARNAEGVEVNFATNYLSKYLLTELVEPALRAGLGRVVVVGSPVVAPRRLLRLDAATGDRTIAPVLALVSAGQATAVWSAELARRWSGTGLSIVTINPVLVRSGISRTWPRALRVLDRMLMAARGVTPERGAEPIVELATTPQVEGLFHRGSRSVRVPRATYDRGLSARVWALSEQLTAQERQQ